ncbi:MAG: trigger factor [Ruminococcaceae bacterium]|nr:trigger factor [Oscillospiraceae bacterium]
MSLKSCEKVETNVYALEIALEGDAFKAAVTKAYNKNKGKYNVPGFRKGKAPKQFIERNYGKEVFWYDAIDAEYPALFEAAVKEAGVEPVAAPFEDSIESIDENGFVIKCKIVVKPEVELKAYKGIKAEKEKVTVKKTEIKEEVEKNLQQNAQLVTVEGKAAKKGDIATIDFEGFVDGVAFEGGKGEGYDLELGSGNFIPGFEEQVIGHKADEEFDITVTFPEEYGAEDLAGKEAVFKIKLHKITKKELPKYDDEFVKDVSEFDTVADYEKHLEEEIKARKEAAANRAFESAVLDALVDNVVAEIPDVMIEKEVDNQLNEFNYRLSAQGLDINTYAQYLGMDINALRESYKADAEKSVKLRLALEKITELEKIEISDEDVETEIKTYSDMYNMPVEQVKKYVSAEDIKADLACRKAMDLVKETAVAGAKKKAAPKADDAAEEKPAAKKTTKKKADAEDASAEKKTTAKKPAAKKAPAKKKADAEKAE